MDEQPEPVIRLAVASDRPELDRFAREVVPEVYGRLVDDDYAQSLVSNWWLDYFSGPIDAGRVLVVMADDRMVGMAEFDQIGDDWVIWKLYIESDQRSRGLGARLLDAVVAELPEGTRRVVLEHVVSNEDAARFYEREGFELGRIDEAEDPRLSIVWRSKMLDA